MPRSSSFGIITGVDFYSEETNPSVNVGSLQWSDDGRAFRYVLAGGSSLVKGNLLQATAEDTQFDEMAVQAAAAVGATTIAVTLGSTATTASLFVGGFMTITTTPGLGQTFTILAHDVAAGAATCNFTVLEPVQTALTTSSKATVRKNPYSGVIQQPTTHTAMAVGFATRAVTNAKYGWIQTHGITAGLSDATVTAAATMGLSPSVTTAGCVTKHVNQDQYVGRSLVAVNVSAKTFPVFAQLD
jgi:uncharacterized protein YdeI (BOF family)